MFYQGVILADRSLRTDYFPAAASANGTLPALACYISQNASGPYLQVAIDYTFQSGCGIVRDATGTYARLYNQPAGYFGSFVIVY